MTQTLEAATLLSEMQVLADPEYAKRVRGFFKTKPGEYAADEVFLGVRVPALRLLVKRYRHLNLATIAEILPSPLHEQRLLALLLLVQAFERGEEDAVYELYLARTQWINNWDLVDVSAHKIVGAYLLGRPREKLYELAQSASLWERRIAIVSTWWFIRHVDLDDTFRLAEILLADKEDLMHKAVGWMLREAGKKSPERLIGFLDQYASCMPRVMLRYAIEKFDKEQRDTYLQRTL